MKRLQKIIIIVSFTVCLISILQSCKKITVPDITTANVSAITATSAVSGGNVTNNGGAEVAARGVCWGTTKDPIINSNPNKTSNGSGNGQFTSNISGLMPNILYHVRAYATNSEGTGYGDNVTFTTNCDSPSAPAVSTITQPTCSVATGSVILSGLPTTGTWTLTRTPDGTTTTGTGTTTTASGLPGGTTYSFTVTNASGCVSATSGNVAINQQPASPLSPVVGTITQPTCSLITGSVALSGLPASGTWTLTRTPGGATTTGTGTSTTVSGLPAGTTYTFTVTNASGCISSASGNVVINTQQAAPLSPVVGTITQPTCSLITGSVALSGLPATGTWTLTRTPGGITTSGSGTSTTISGLAAGTYTFTVTNASGCISSASGNVLINMQQAAPSAPVVGSITQPTCSVTTGSVALSSLPATGTWTLTRTPGGITTSGSGTITTISGLAVGTYTFTVTNASGCTSEASGNVVINLLPAPSATISYASTILDVSATLNATVNANGYSTIVTFEYGTDTNYGSTITANQSPVTGTSNIAVNATVTRLSPITLYHFRVKAVNCGGTIYSTDMIFTTHLCPVTNTVIHYAGDVSPVSKTLIYGIVQTNLSGSNKCWINKNLGADDRANSATDAREEAAGWYWQFNRKQGFKHDGSTRTPGTTWITSIVENSNWTIANDPCNILLGTGWRLPTYSEWANANGSWSSSSDTYTSVLKLHVSGLLGPSDGILYFRGLYGFYWSSTQGSTNTRGLYLDFRDSWSNTAYCSKWYAYPVRCLKD
jgi:hypothetical protein